jgi:hypothetical protein
VENKMDRTLIADLAVHITLKNNSKFSIWENSCESVEEYHIKNEYISLNNTWDNLEKELHWSSKYSFFSAMSSLSHLDIVKEARNVMMDKRR